MTAYATVFHAISKSGAPVLTALLCLAVAKAAIANQKSAIPLTLFVATNGNDAWSGVLAAPNRQRNDGPLASLSGARDAIRRMRSGDAAQSSSPVSVLVRGGTYRLDAPFILESQDSGASKAPVLYAAYKKERPVLSGGRVLSGFRQHGKLWEATIPEVKDGGWYFHQLFVNGHRRQRARSPNDGYFRIAALVPGPMDAASKRAVVRDRFVFKPGDLQPFARLSDVNLVLMHSWETSIHPLKSVDVESNTVQFAAPLKEWWGIGYWENAQRYYIENAFEALDAPGEWYLNRETGVLAYWPMPGERIEQTEIVAPRLLELARLAGKADEGKLIRNVTIKGLSFQHNDWELSPTGNSSTQAAVEVPAAVTADGANGCSFEDCEIAHVGTYGLWFRRGCQDCRIQRNKLFDLGAGGIRVGEDRMAKTDAAESSRNLVDNNHIFDGGRVYPAGIGIWVAQSSFNRISHNDIHDLFYSGMSIGWNWNDATNRTHHNIIEFNHVHHLGHAVLSDEGLIYCLGSSPGSVIRNNVFHDIWPYSTPPFGWGIYLDATCSGYLVENNVVFNTRSGGLFYNNGGHQHVVQNNIFALSADYALWPYWEKRPNTFRRNIVLVTRGELLVKHAERTLQERVKAGESLGEWVANLYWHTNGAQALKFFRRDFPAWQELGLDQHSQIADPKFANVSRYDFRLKRSSPALKLGFQEIDTAAVGLYGEPTWANQVRHIECGAERVLDGRDPPSDH